MSPTLGGLSNLRPAPSTPQVPRQGDQQEPTPDRDHAPGAGQVGQDQAADERAYDDPRKGEPAAVRDQEQEEAEEELEVGYEGEELEIGFNVNYLLDALAAIDAQEVQVGLTDGNSSCLIRAAGDTTTSFVVMPMRL